MNKDFFKINLGHVLVLIAWLVTAVWGYSDLNTRQKTTEANVIILKSQIEAISGSRLNDIKDASSQLSTLNSKIATMANDIDWIKKNIK